MASEERDEDSGSEGTILSVDAILDLLAHHHRREMLRVLRESSDHSITEDTLISHLQDQEEQRTGMQPSWDHIFASLHHIHVPKLGEGGVVTYEEGNGRYKYQSNDRIEQWLNHIDSLHESES